MKSKLILHIVASVTLTVGLWGFIHNRQSYIQFFSGFGTMFSMLGPWLTVVGLLSMLIPIIKCVAAVGLISFRRWAWLLAVVVLVADILIRAGGAMKMFLVDKPSAVRLSRVPFEGQVETISISMWPSYLVIIISLGCLLMLIHVRIQALLNEKNDGM